ncbi:nitrilase [Perkinsela sp. CCAP 1560/4]|nr:nitrilase [Perkinsela sp. CCAP 1560/4]|eukprot:KNH06282.1 nitrilase [Perkinsela sp. CCAP 1560/4]
MDTIEWQPWRSLFSGQVELSDSFRASFSKSCSHSTVSLKELLVCFTKIVEDREYYKKVPSDLIDSVLKWIFRGLGSQCPSLEKLKISNALLGNLTVNSVVDDLFERVFSHLEKGFVQTSFEELSCGELSELIAFLLHGPESKEVFRERVRHLLFGPVGILPIVHRKICASSSILDPQLFKRVLSPYLHYGISETNADTILALFGSKHPWQLPELLSKLKGSSDVNGLVELAGVLSYLAGTCPIITFRHDSDGASYVNLLFCTSELVGAIITSLHCYEVNPAGGIVSINDQVPHLSHDSLREFLRTITRINRVFQRISTVKDEKWYTSFHESSKDASAQSALFAQHSTLYSPYEILRVRALLCDAVIDGPGGARQSNGTDSTNQENLHKENLPAPALSSSPETLTNAPSLTISVQFLCPILKPLLTQLLAAVISAPSIESLMSMLREWELCALSAPQTQSSRSSEIFSSFPKGAYLACNRFGLPICLYDAITLRIMELMGSTVQATTDKVSIGNTHAHVRKIQELCTKGKIPIQQLISQRNMETLLQSCAFSVQSLVLDDRGTIRSVGTTSYPTSCPLFYASSTGLRKNSRGRVFHVYSCPFQKYYPNPQGTECCRAVNSDIQMEDPYPKPWSAALLYTIGIKFVKTHCTQMKSSMRTDHSIQEVTHMLHLFVQLQSLAPESQEFNPMIYPVAKRGTAPLDAPKKLPSPIGFAYFFLDQVVQWVTTTMPHLQAALIHQNGDQSSANDPQVGIHAVVCMLYVFLCTLPQSFPLPRSVVGALRQYYFAPDMSTVFVKVVLPQMSPSNVCCLVQIFDYVSFAHRPNIKPLFTAFHAIMQHALGVFYSMTKRMMEFLDGNGSLTCPNASQVAFITHTLVSYLKRHEQSLIRPLEPLNITAFSIEKHIARSILSAGTAEKIAAGFLDHIYRRFMQKPFFCFISAHIGSLTKRESLQFLSALMLLQVQTQDELITKLVQKTQMLCRMDSNRMTVFTTSDANDAQNTPMAPGVECQKTRKVLSSVAYDQPSPGDTLQLIHLAKGREQTGSTLLPTLIRALPFFTLPARDIVDIFTALLQSEEAHGGAPHIQPCHTLARHVMQSIEYDGSQLVMHLKSLSAPHAQNTAPKIPIWAPVAHIIHVNGLMGALPAPTYTELLRKLCSSLHARFTSASTPDAHCDLMHSVESIPRVLAAVCSNEAISHMNARALLNLIACLGMVYSLLPASVGGEGQTKVITSVYETMDVLFDARMESRIWGALLDRVYALVWQEDASCASVITGVSTLTAALLILQVSMAKQSQTGTISGGYLQRLSCEHRVSCLRGMLAEDVQSIARLMHLVIPFLSKGIPRLTLTELMQLAMSYGSITVLAEIVDLHDTTQLSDFTVCLDGRRHRAVLPVSFCKDLLVRLLTLRHELTFDDFHFLGTLFANVFRFHFPRGFLEEISTNIFMLMHVELNTIAAIGDSSQSGCLSGWKSKRRRIDRVIQAVQLLSEEDIDVPESVMEKIRTLHSTGGKDSTKQVV